MMSSSVSTPTLGPHTPQALPPVSSRSPLGANPSSQAALNDNIPPLSLELLTSQEDKAAALKLVADSIAQQRQAAAFHLVFHPLPLAAILAVLAAIYRYAWTQNSQHDLGTVLMLASGAIMTYLTAIRFFTSGYLRAAEEISWDFLTAGRDGDEEDLVFGTRYGTDVVGALVLRLERPWSPSDGNSGGSGGGGGSRRKGHSRQNSFKAHSRQNSFKLKGGRGGLGGDLLREAVRVTRERCGKDAEVGFAKEHANSIMVLPEMFNSPFRKGEMRAARALEKVLGERDGRRR
ncbi:hypothetical protein B0I37DRAFT_368908 [Chaetomium sp. MPI-CAGE-AT-0009]|nr:hypothetical protein B0I37DRAFT_368908 [Chaetomium sp. MPI-CAGE-AT-0009]